MRVSRVPSVNASTDCGRPAHDDVGETQQRVGVGLHRPRDVDEQHDLPRPAGVVAAEELAHLALVAQRGAQGPSGIGLAVPRRGSAPRRAGRRLGAQQREQPPQVLTLGGGELGEIAVAQDLRAAGAGVHLGSVVVFAVAGLVLAGRRERGEPRRRRFALVDDARSAALAGGEPLLEGLVVARQVVGIRAERETAGPVGLHAAGDVERVERPEERGDAVGGDREPGVAQHDREADETLDRVVDRIAPCSCWWSRAQDASRVSSCLRMRSASSRYLRTAPSVAAALSTSRCRAPTSCSARAQSMVSATPGGLSEIGLAQRADGPCDLGGEPLGEAGQPRVQDLDLPLQVGVVEPEVDAAALEGVVHLAGAVGRQHDQRRRGGPDLARSPGW